MKTFLKIFFTILIYCFPFINYQSSIINCNAQNLVPNPSFEEYTSCPVSTNQVYLATGWSIDINSSDYYNSCADYNSMVTVPNSGTGYQCPATGNAYCGFAAYREIQDQYREYFGRALSNSLIIGQKYFISFKLSLANYVSNCAVNKVGVKFTNVNYGDTTLLPVPILVMNNTAHFYTNMIISDTSSWTIVKGTYIADSSYQYILIGNFFDNSNTDTSIIFGTWCQSYYLIDDICVSIDSLTCEIPNGPNVCDTTVNVSETKYNNESITIYSNPANEKIQIKYLYPTESTIKIYNIFGQLLFVKNFSEKNIKIDMSSYTNGIYIIQIQQDNKFFNKKITLIK